MSKITELFTNKDDRDYKGDVEAIFKEFANLVSASGANANDAKMKEFEGKLKIIKNEMRRDIANYQSKIMRILGWLAEFRSQDEKLYSQQANNLNTVFAVLMGISLLAGLAISNISIVYLSAGVGVAGLGAILIILKNKKFSPQYGSKLDEMIFLNEKIREAEEALSALDNKLSEVNWIADNSREGEVQ